MNLLQIQDQLKSLPNDPRTMQALAAYANGANPAVPPYLALGELNRRKQLIERAKMEQAGQPPQGTVKDQVEQQAGIMALQAGRQQQAMQNAVRMGSMAPQPVPDNVPQPEVQQEVQAASGGLMSLLEKKAKRMNSGGIIAFAKGGDEGEEESAADVINEAVDEAEDERDDSNFVSPSDLKGAAANAQEALRIAARFAKNSKTPEVETPMEFRQRMIRENPEKYGYLEKDVAPDVMERLDQLQAAQRAESDKRREEAQKLKPGILQLLGQAAMQSRGQQGRSALASILGGYSELQQGAEAKAVQQEQALRAKELEMQQVKMETINTLQKLKRAQDEGDIRAEQKAKMDLAKIAKDQNKTVGDVIRAALTSTASLSGRLGAAETRAKATEAAAREATLRKQQPGERERMANKIASLRAQGKNDEADRLERAYRGLSGSTAEVGGINAQRAILSAQLREVNRVLDPKNFEATDDEKAAARAEKARILKDLEGLRTPGAPAPVPAAGSAVPLPPNASPSTLKKGTIYQTARGPGRWNGTAFEAVQ